MKKASLQSLYQVSSQVIHVDILRIIKRVLYLFNYTSAYAQISVSTMPVDSSHIDIHNKPEKAL